MILYFHSVAHEEFNVRSSKDNRVKVDRVIIAYKDEQGNEYRKSFEAKGREPEYPKGITYHEQCNRIKYQY